MLRTTRLGLLTRPYPLSTKINASLSNCRRYASTSFGPLRILFCGADSFSITSLQALHKEHENNRSLIKSIDVVCRPGKWTGPSKKIFKEVPIAETARLLGLPLHQIDTFTGWAPPSIDIIVAVSFGLLVPKRLIEGATYGGINVHPSLLPDLYGAAPLAHALLHDDSHTGITVQTLHPTKMDNGKILAQTPYPGVPIPSRGTMTIPELGSFTAPLGAQMLTQVLRDGLFVPPVHDLAQQAQNAIRYRDAVPRHARKLDIEDRHIGWKTWDSAQIMRRARLLGRLWSNFAVPASEDAKDGIASMLKVLWPDEFEVLDHDTSHPDNNGLVQQHMPPGHAYLSSDRKALLVNTVDNKTFKVHELTVAGSKRTPVASVDAKYGLVDEAKSKSGHGLAYYPTWNPFT